MCVHESGYIFVFHCCVFMIIDLVILLSRNVWHVSVLLSTVQRSQKRRQSFLHPGPHPPAPSGGSRGISKPANRYSVLVLSLVLSDGHAWIISTREASRKCPGLRTMSFQSYKMFIESLKATLRVLSSEGWGFNWAGNASLSHCTFIRGR